MRMKEFSPQGPARARARRCAWEAVSLLGLEHNSNSGQGGGEREAAWERSAEVRWLGRLWDLSSA